LVLPVTAQPDAKTEEPKFVSFARTSAETKKTAGNSKKQNKKGE